MMQATLSRSIMRSALVEAVCGLTESSFRSSTLRPIMPPAALISSTARSAAITAYSPSGPRKPVRGVRWPILMTSAVCAQDDRGRGDSRQQGKAAGGLQQASARELIMLGHRPSSPWMTAWAAAFLLSAGMHESRLKKRARVACRDL